jgi:membrane associated rhomboid family serine protease
MGIQDRDYYRQTPPSFGRTSMLSISIWLVIINVGVFVIDRIFFAGMTYRLELNGKPVTGGMTLLEAYGHFSAYTAISLGQVWRFVTFQFLHGGVWHLAGNMLGIYFFGPLIEQYLGRRRFIAFYLLCGATGPIAYLLLQMLGVLIPDPVTPLIGASAGVFGILLAGATIAPRMTVQLLFPPIPIQFKTLAYIMLAFAVYTVFTRGNNAGGEAAHLGGAALGWYLIRNPHLLNWADRIGSRKPKMKIRY